jgi:predicted transcriptional regulator of viral defense system
MVTMRPQEFFARKPVFTHNEFVAFLDAEQPRSKKTRESLLTYYTKTGRLLHVRRGLYVVVPLGVNPATCPVDPYLLAAKMTDDAVLAYHTALEFFGRAHSVHERFIYLTNHAPRPVTFRSYRFCAALFPKKLRDKGRETFAVNTAERAGISVKVTSLERTLVDVLTRPRLAGGWEEIWRSLESVEFFDLDQVVEYALLLDNATTVARVGFFLEQHRETLMVDDAHLKRLQERRPSKPHYMERGGRRRGYFASAWNLVVPMEVVRRSWREVL